MGKRAKDQQPKAKGGKKRKVNPSPGSVSSGRRRVRSKQSQVATEPSPDTGFQDAPETIRVDPDHDQDAANIALGIVGPRKSGLLVGVEPGSILNFDIFNPTLDVDALFAPTKGDQLFRFIKQWFGDKLEHQPLWFEVDGQTQRAIVKSPLSRKLQESTLVVYGARQLEEGLSPLTSSGAMIFKWRDASRTYPIEAGSGNHRIESYYRNEESHSANANIKYLRETGFESVQKFVHNIPPKIFEKMISALNKHAPGSGHNHVDFMTEALALEDDWKAASADTWIKWDHPSYEAISVLVVQCGSMLAYK